MAISQEQLTIIKNIAQSYGATRLILFGSTVDNPAAARDVDLACDGVSGWKFYELAARIEDAINMPLDLVPLSPSNRFVEMVERRGKRLL